MLKKIARWYQGYLCVELCNGAPERFFNLCRKNGIVLWDIFQYQGKIFCYMELQDYWSIRTIARKTKVWPKVIRKVGGPFWALRIRKRKGMMLGFFSGVFLLYVLSLFVWDISFEGQSAYTEEFLLKYLKGINVCTGMRLTSVDCKKIEDSIRKNYPEIGWVSAELEGTKLSIHLVETNFSGGNEKKIKNCHIVANRDGIVYDIVTRSGMPLVKKGEQVKKGDILISGVLSYTDDSGNIVKKQVIGADGDVKIKALRNVTETCGMFYTQKKYTGYCKKVVQVVLFNRNLYLTNPFKGFNKERKYDIISNVCDWKLSKSFVLPVSYGNVYYREYEEYDIQFTKEQAQTVLEKKIQENIKRIKEAGGSIVHKEQEALEQNGLTFTLRARITTIEPGNEYKKIKRREWRNIQINGIDGDNAGDTYGT